jgi:hypothetical protein
MNILASLSSETLLQLAHRKIEPVKSFSKEMLASKKKVSGWGKIASGALGSFKIPAQDFTIAAQKAGKSFDAMCHLLAVHIGKTYIAQKEHFIKKAEVLPGASAWRKSTPMQHVGIYWPSAMQERFEKLLPVVLAAKSAGCPNVHVFTSPDELGKTHPHFLAALKLIGIETVYVLPESDLFAWLLTGNAGFDSFVAWEEGNSLAAQLAMPGVPYDVWLANSPQLSVLLPTKGSDPKPFAKAMLLMAKFRPASNLLLLAPDEGFLESCEIILKDTLADKEWGKLAERVLNDVYAFALQKNQDWQKEITAELREWMVWLTDGSMAQGNVPMGHHIQSDNIENVVLSDYLGWHTTNLLGLSGTGHPLSVMDFYRYSAHLSITEKAADLVWPLVEGYINPK